MSPPRPQPAAPVQPVHLFVAAVVVAALGALALAFAERGPVPGAWELLTFALLALLLEQLATQIRPGAYGSTAFVMHLSAGVLFGPFWGGVVTGISAGASFLARRLAPIKVAFNTAQLVLAVAASFLLYTRLGGALPPRVLWHAGAAAPTVVTTDVGLFLVAAASYFLFNSTAVSAALALTGAGRFGRIWLDNNRGVVLYDLGASALALLVTAVFLSFREAGAWYRAAFVLVLVPVIVVRHIYGMNRRLQEAYERLEDAYGELEEKVREQLQMMVKAVEAHDPYTSGHSARVSTLSTAIARELGLAEAEVEEIGTAALLHDVGKAHADFAAVVRKEGTLTAEEWELLKGHAARGAELVAIASSFRGRVEAMVRHHHERWDGAGYPDGLAGEAIPPGARIIGVADTIDAMMTDRPYRKALSLDVVIAELLRHRGRQFEPRLVDLVTGSVTIRRLLQGPVAAEPLPPVLARKAPRASRVRWR